LTKIANREKFTVNQTKYIQVRFIKSREVAIATSKNSNVKKGL